MERTMSCGVLRELVVGPAKFVLLDVRRRPAFDADPRMIPGAIWRDPEQAGTWAAGLSHDRPLVVYCVHGHEVSRGVVDHLRALGLDAALLEGGIEAWQATGGPVTADSATRD
jgi:rhodanese-related sulfurtransferase